MKKRNLLYNAAYEHDACGTGFIASSTGETSHRILQFAIEGVCNLTHRGAINADAKTVTKQIIDKLVIKKYITKKNLWTESCLIERKKHLVKRDEEKSLLNSLKN